VNLLPSWETSSFREGARGVASPSFVWSGVPWEPQEPAQGRSWVGPPLGQEGVQLPHAGTHQED
jgi:hypothetical protein